jgi:hypothetical protein
MLSRFGQPRHMAPGQMQVPGGTFNLVREVAKAGGGAIYDPSTLWGAADHLPRRNLLTYSEDLANGVWLKTNVTISANTVETLDPNGTNKATKLTSAGLPVFGRAASNGITTISGQQYTTTLRLKASTAEWVILQVSDQGVTHRTRVWFNLVTGAKGGSAVTGSGVVVDYGITNLGNGWYEIYSKATNPITSTFIYVYPVTADLSITQDNKNWYSMGVMFAESSTTNQAYQAITDWTTEQYAWAAAKNVPWLRRNALTYTEDFSNAIWIKYRGPTLTGGQLDPLGGSTATKIIPVSTATSPGVYQASTAVAAGTTVRMSFYAKAAEFSWVMIGSPAAGAGVWFNVSTGAIGTITGGFTAAIEAAANGFFRCTLIGSAVATTYTQISVCDGNGSTAVTNSGTNGVIVWGAQLSVGTCEYQKVSSTWDAQYASNAAAAGVALTMYQDSAGTTAVSSPDQPIGKLVDLSGGNYHAVQSGATGLKPVLRLCPNGGWYLQRDLSDDNLVATYPNWGTACVTYVNNGSAVTETTGVTLNGATNLNTPAADYGRIYLSAPSSKSASIIKWLKAKAGIA